jgi:hypothetical protein
MRPEGHKKSVYRLSERLSLGWAWVGALGCFVLAGATGGLYRYGLMHGFRAGLQLSDVRHAHSHLMYFGWVTPALMALIARRLLGSAHQRLDGGWRPVIGLTLIVELLAFPPFLFFGYRSIPVGRGRLPVAVIAARLLISLIPLTSLWPAQWSGRWSLEFAAWMAWAPVLIALMMLALFWVRYRPMRRAVPATNAVPSDP